MTTTVRAVYQNGVLRLAQPLPLAEGTSVDVSVTPAPEHDEITGQIKAARSVDELVAVLDTLPSDDGGYDILAALNENRIWSGEHPLLPPGGPTR